MSVARTINIKLNLGKLIKVFLFSLIYPTMFTLGEIYLHMFYFALYRNESQRQELFVVKLFILPYFLFILP